MVRDFKPNKADHLRACQGKELFEGAVYYIEDVNGILHKCVLELAWWPTERMKQEARTTIARYSKEGKLFTRRDKAFQDFRDMLEN